MSSPSSGKTNNPVTKAEVTESSSDEDDDIYKRFASLNVASAADTHVESVLDEVSIDGIIKFIKDRKCQNIITLAGAGISTSAGIPDYRSPGSGLYYNLQKYNLPSPDAIFDISYFRRNPQPFFSLAKELFPGIFKPTPSHYFIRLLQEKNLLLRHYTQNIDTLERVAGISGDKIVEAHGTFYTSHCLDCAKEYSLAWIQEFVMSEVVPKCEVCEGIVKPDIVFFGENLPSKFFYSLVEDFPQCDLLIILGSSLVVQPFCTLVDKVPNFCPRLLINREKVGARNPALAFLGLSGGLKFDEPSNGTDVAWLGDCDDVCLEFADKLGWKSELELLIKEEHAKINKEQSKKEEKKSKNLETSAEEAKSDVSASCEKAKKDSSEKAKVVCGEEVGDSSSTKAEKNS